MVDTVRQVRSVVSLKHSEDRTGSQLEPHSGKAVLATFTTSV